MIILGSHHYPVAVGNGQPEQRAVLRDPGAAPGLYLLRLFQPVLQLDDLVFDPSGIIGLRR